MPREEMLALLLFTPLEKPWLLINEKRQIEMFPRMRNGQLSHYVITAVCSQDNIISVSPGRSARSSDANFIWPMQSAHSSTVQFGIYVALPFAGAVCCRGEDTEYVFRMITAVKGVINLTPSARAAAALGYRE